MATLDRQSSDRQRNPYWLAPERSPVLVGRNGDNDIVLDDDQSVSSNHAEFTFKSAAWWVTDLDSRNGTFVQGMPVHTPRRLRDGETIRMGRTNLVFNDEATRVERTTEQIRPPPEITRGERRVLIELCRPLRERQAFTPPASVADIAKKLVVVKGAVQAHLEHLYDKLEIYPDESIDRRVRLANVAIERGLVTWRDLEPDAVDSPEQ